MAVMVDHYFSMVSPWAYIGHDAFHEMADRRGVEIRYRPVQLPSVFEATGGLPLGKRHPARQALRWVELQRWRDKRGVKLNLQPKHWPFAAATADRMVLAIQEAGDDPAAFMRAVFVGVWADEKDMADEAVLIATADAAGLDGKAVLASAKSDAIGKLYEDNIASAIAVGCIGSPGYVLNGEVFWGQDRLDLLEDAIASGRAPYKPLA
jgi:2-hydroxychromene-2-carboxylate isomerase